MKHFHLLFFAALTCAIANGQKLPNKQQVSLRAPANIKVDGKANEWGSFRAYNTATDLFYTLANDEQNLYLILQAGSKAAMAKIFGSGISLFLNHANNSNKNSLAVISYLKFPKDNRFAIDEMIKDTVANNIAAINKAISAALKTITVKDLDGVNEDVISVYNDYGIAAASYLVNTNTYTCELAIPLRYLKSFINNNGVLSYTLQANGVSLNSLKVVVNGKVEENANASPQLMEMMNNVSQSENGAKLRDLMSDTNVTGEYTLVK